MKPAIYTKYTTTTIPGGTGACGGTKGGGTKAAEIGVGGAKGGIGGGIGCRANELTVIDNGIEAFDIMSFMVGSLSSRPRRRLKRESAVLLLPLSLCTSMMSSFRGTVK